MSTTTTAIRITPPTALDTAMVMMCLVSLGDPVVLFNGVVGVLALVVLAEGAVPGTFKLSLQFQSSFVTMMIYCTQQCSYM